MSFAQQLLTRPVHRVHTLRKLPLNPNGLLTRLLMSWSKESTGSNNVITALRDTGVVFAALEDVLQRRLQLFPQEALSHVFRVSVH